MGNEGLPPTHLRVAPRSPPTGLPAAVREEPENPG
jgi:hypothetical protein